MNESELILDVARAADPDALRQVACACCRRIFQAHAGLFRTFVYRPDDNAEPWSADTLRAALAAIEAPDGAGTSTGRLRPDQLAAAAESSYQRWSWANYRLGDHADGTDYEDAFVTWKSAAAVAASCADDIRASIGDCLKCAAEAIAFRWDEAEQRSAFAAERAVQADLVLLLVGRPSGTTSTRVPSAVPVLTLEDKATGARHTVSGRTACVIGRDDGADLRLADPTVARRHARLTLAEGQWSIEDVKSSGGTFVDGEIVRAPRPLRDGDVIQLSGVELVVRLGVEILER